MGSFDPMGVWAAQERVLTPPFIVSMSPPSYPSAWLRPRSARFRFARQNHCSSATTCRFSPSGLPVTTPEPRPARPDRECYRLFTTVTCIHRRIIRTEVNSMDDPSRPFKCRALVVEDDPLVLETTAAIVRSFGFSVRTAEDGFAALKVL